MPILGKLSVAATLELCALGVGRGQYLAPRAINYGGNYQNVSIAWQYSWIGWPK